MSDDDKSESASSQRLDSARKKGQIPRSKEFTTAIAFLFTFFYFYLSIDPIFTDIKDLFNSAYQFDTNSLKDASYPLDLVGKSLYLLIKLFAPLFVYKLIIIILSSLLLGGWIVSFSSIAPKFEKINPIAGVKRIFSITSIVEFFKNVAKISLIFYILYDVVYQNLDSISVLSRSSAKSSILMLSEIFFWYIMSLLAVILCFGLLDIPYQKFDFSKNMKMSKDEVKQEHISSEGRPEIKAKIRQIQLQMAKGSINQSVPSADVVLMNPTHYAVAIKFDLTTADAPYLVAKGMDETAFYIKEIADINNVEVIVIPDLTRSIYHSTQVNQMIPNQLFIAVAHVLTYVNQLREWKKGKAMKPDRLPTLSIPDISQEQ